MQIGFNKDEYLLLLHMIEISDWVLNAWKVEDDEDTREYRTLFQKLFAKAKSFKMEHLLERLRNGELAFNSEYEAQYSAQEFIDEYEDDVLWTGLIERLGMRDFAREYGEDAISGMNIKERIEKETPFEEKWSNEFEEHGYSRIFVKSEDES